MAAKTVVKTRSAVMLNRGRRYRHEKTTYFRNVPVVVDEETAAYLVDDTGFFRMVQIGANGKAILPKVKAKRSRSGRRNRIHTGDGPALADTGDSAAGSGANTEGAQGV